MGFYAFEGTLASGDIVELLIVTVVLFFSATFPNSVMVIKFDFFSEEDMHTFKWFLEIRASC